MRKKILSKQLKDLIIAEIALERAGYLTDEIRGVFSKLKDRELKKIK